MSEQSAAVAGVRLDVWLDVACLFKTRSEAQKACNGGKVEVNGQPGKSHRLLKIGRGPGAVRGPHAAADARGTRAARHRAGVP
jgi:hypothetical protein